MLWKAITQLEAWGSGLVGNINAEVGKRRTTATCLDAHKASGDIR